MTAIHAGTALMDEALSEADGAANAAQDADVCLDVEILNSMERAAIKREVDI